LSHVTKGLAHEGVGTSSKERYRWGSSATPLSRRTRGPPVRIAPVAFRGGSWRADEAAMRWADPTQCRACRGITTRDIPSLFPCHSSTKSLAWITAIHLFDNYFHHLGSLLRSPLPRLDTPDTSEIMHRRFSLKPRGTWSVWYEVNVPQPESQRRRLRATFGAPSRAPSEVTGQLLRAARHNDTFWGELILLKVAQYGCPTAIGELFTRF